MPSRIDESRPEVLITLTHRNLHLLHLILQFLDEPSLVLTAHDILIVRNDGTDHLASDLIEKVLWDFLANDSGILQSLQIQEESDL